MSKYPTLVPPSYISFDPSSLFGVALQRSRELNQKKKVTVTSSSELKKDADNSSEKVQSLKRQNSSSNDQQYPNKLPCLSDSTESKLTGVQKDTAGNIILTEEYKVRYNATAEMISLLAPILKLQSGCEISFPHNDHRSFILFGTRQAIDLAKQLIQMIIEKLHLSSRMESMDVLTQLGPRQIEMIIPGRKVSIVIGTNGSTIRMLRWRTHCKIDIVIDSFSHLIDRTLRITGEPSNCRHAQELIKSLIGTNTNNIQEKNISDLIPRKGSLNNGQFSQPVIQKVTFYVPTKAIGLIIGQKASTIKQIRKQSGLLYLRVSNYIPADPNKKYLVMQGTPQEIYCAQQLVQEKIKEYQMQTSDFSPELTKQAQGLEMVSYPRKNSLSGTQTIMEDSEEPDSTASLPEYYLSQVGLIEQSNQEDLLSRIPDTVRYTQPVEQFANQYSQFTPHPTVGHMQSSMVQFENVQSGQYRNLHMAQHQNFVAEHNNRIAMSMYHHSQAVQNIKPFMPEHQYLQDEHNWQPSSSYQYSQAEQYPSLIHY